MSAGKFISTVAIWLALAAALTNFGCRNLKVNEKRSDGIVLPKSKMENDSVAVRVAVVELDDQQQTQFADFVETTDQKLPLEIRQRLDDNGLRVSVISSINTPDIQKMLAPRIQDPRWLDGQELELAEAGKLEPIYRMASHRHVEKKRGQSFTVEVSPVRQKSSWVVYVGESQFPDRASLAQCHMRITSWPMPDGSVRLQFIPEVHYGQNLSRIGVDGTNFAVQQRRDVKELRALSFEISVQPGETVMVAPTNRLERIGDLFFNAKVDVVDDTEPAHADWMDSIERGLTTDSSELTDDVDTSEFFPMLNAENSTSESNFKAGNELDASSESELESLDAAVLVQGELLEDRVLEPDRRRPEPWQRFLLVRVTEVTPPPLR
ncbi:hypothetical protein [Mariniblastus fucicola]|uniref:Uncharacterized protein n=1 Tax=Mariniblastus fucicola TaxID=980251 RepID=A0A5B9PDI1_9BACT|nr:hypothetical protein [Mariniblastus fucicola]QEG24747.1 hypothetical protein MFFC18_46690 [Mariniblastus fucicola]